MSNMRIQLGTAKPGAELSQDGWLSSENIIVIGCDVNGSSLPPGSPKAAPSIALKRRTGAMHDRH